MKKTEHHTPVRTRFAPSPTGVLHIGGARTALFNYLFARKHNGSFILRIEDTDTKRSRDEYEEEIQESLSWLGIEWDELYKQSDRTDLYSEAVTRLIDAGAAYVSQEEVRAEGDRPEVIRFKNPNTRITFTDMIRGDVSFDTHDLGDFVIARSTEEPLYHLTVVVDDHDMNISHVIRAEEHISNTPRQILIQEALGLPRQVYAHIPLILAPDKSKLSKRHGAVSVLEYRDKGVLPDALVNHLALLGWNPGTDQEIFTRSELIKAFSLENVQKGGAVFNEDKLRWINKDHIKHLPPDNARAEFSKRLEAHAQTQGWKLTPEYTEALWKIFSERITFFSDVDDLVEQGEFTYFFEKPPLDKETLRWKDDPLEDAMRHLEHVQETLSNIEEDSFTEEGVKKALWDYASEEGRGSVLWPFRYALSGRERSPDPFTLSETLGKKETLDRVAVALKYSTS